MLARLCHGCLSRSELPTFMGTGLGLCVLPRTRLTRTWVNRRYDARSVDDPGYTDTVGEDFDRIADLSEAEGWDRRVVMGPRLASRGAAKHLEDHPKVALRCEVRDPGATELTAEDHVVLTLGPRNAVSSKFAVAMAT